MTISTLSLPANTENSLNYRREEGRICAGYYAEQQENTVFHDFLREKMTYFFSFGAIELLNGLYRCSFNLYHYSLQLNNSYLPTILYFMGLVSVSSVSFLTQSSWLSLVLISVIHSCSSQTECLRNSNLCKLLTIYRKNMKSKSTSWTVFNVSLQNVLYFT